jgi:hypothetical protein
MTLASATIDTRRLRYPVVRTAFEHRGVCQLPDDPSAQVVWCDMLMRPDDFAMLYPHQRVSRIPGMDSICLKTTFFQGLASMKTVFPSLYTFFPITYQLPCQFSNFQREHLRLCGEMANRSLRFDVPHTAITWIVKPRSGSCGHGIRLVQNSFDVATHMEPGIVQRYVVPYLLDGYKFDFRLYILISNLNPFTVYLYNEGLARFCTHRYLAPTRDTLNDKFCHLTNTAINSQNAKQSALILEAASVVLNRIAGENARASGLWARIREVVLLSIIAQYPAILENVTGMEIRQEEITPPRKVIEDMRRYFQIVGIDIMISDRCDPIVLELNDRPSMCVTYEIERHLKTRVIYDALNVVTVDGEESGVGSDPGGWEKLLPTEGDSPFTKAVAAVMERVGQQAVAKKGFYRRQDRSLCSLPPLHQ